VSVIAADITISVNIYLKFLHSFTEAICARHRWH